MCSADHGHGCSRQRAALGAMAWLLAGTLAACSATEGERQERDGPTAVASSAIHDSHTGPAPWSHVLTCYGGCQAPYYDPSACNHPTSCGPIADGTWWYATERAAFHCGAKLRLERGDLCVVVDVQDNGPADWVEEDAATTCGTPYIIDTSPLVADYFGGGCGWSECFMVDVSQVPDSTPTGPEGCEICECTEGEQETEACGNCGSRSRTCQSDCQWSDWTDCAGEGPCAAQTTETEDCCDCGQRSRTCGDDCTWSDWSVCDGPDPDGGQTPCDTGLAPPCNAGLLRCVEGCVTCMSTRWEEPEVCNGADDDCDGLIDDGNPTELSSPPPAFAARLLDAVLPAELAAGELRMATAVFENAGSSPWPAGQIWLAAVDEQGAVPSAVRAPSWPASEVAIQTSEPVAPGASTTLVFELQAPSQPAQLREEFRLLAPDGTPMRCPGPGLELDLVIGDGVPGGEPPPGDALPATIVGECTCRHAGARPHRESAPGWLALGLLGAVRRRRGRRLRQPPQR